MTRPHATGPTFAPQSKLTLRRTSRSLRSGATAPRGGALARLRSLELGAGEELLPEIRAALETTEAWVAAALASGSVNYSLCHGLAGNAEVLLEGDRLLPASAAALAHRVAAAGVETYLACGLPWPSDAHGGATPCLFLGLAGIGRFYLRLAQPDLPSLLLVRSTQPPSHNAPTPR